MRLGEILMRDGRINASQLKTALEAQLIYGGHLGTNLVELGFIDIDTLGATLAAEFRIQQAQQEMIERVPHEVLEKIPAKLVERHHVIPFEFAERTLHVAMIDPRNLLALDELSFACGCRVEAWVAPELLIINAMRRHYGIGRGLRHIPVSGQPRSQVMPRPEAPPAEPSPTGVTPLPAAVEPPPAELAAAETHGPTFVPQTVPAYRRDAEAKPGGTAGGEAVAIAWIKTRVADDVPERWGELFALDLNDEHFDDLEGVYVVWHRGQDPVLNVGCGPIRSRLHELRCDPAIVKVLQSTEVYVTWARVDPTVQDRVGRYLVTALNPQIIPDLPEVEPIPVDLPR